LPGGRRARGPQAALLVIAGDVLKGVAACLFGYLLTAGEFGSESLFDYKNPNIGLMLAGTGSIFGHIFPVFFQFQSGRGILTAAAVIFMIDWRIGAVFACLFVIVLLLTRYASVASMVAAAGLPVAGIVMEKPGYSIVYTVAIALLIIIHHRGNIANLLNGSEIKIKIGR